MTVTCRRFVHLLPFVLVGAAALAPAGCGGDDGVSKTHVAKSTARTKGESEPTGPIDPMPGEFRILGGMFPADKPQWFFKLVGPTDALEPLDAGFQKLLASVSLSPNGDPPGFTTPDGWTRAPGTGAIVVATIKTPDGKYVVSVSSAMGDVPTNLKRWSVDQLGNAKFTAADVGKYTRTVQAQGVIGLRTDLRGPKSPPPPGAGGPMMGGGGAKPPGHP
jgi:hypothetical protein